MENSKGIMLITLIITIIVMILLAAIVLNGCEVSVNYTEGITSLCPTCGREMK